MHIKEWFVKVGKRPSVARAPDTKTAADQAGFYLGVAAGGLGACPGILSQDVVLAGLGATICSEVGYKAGQSIGYNLSRMWNGLCAYCENPAYYDLDQVSEGTGRDIEAGFAALLEAVTVLGGESGGAIGRSETDYDPDYRKWEKGRFGPEDFNF